MLDVKDKTTLDDWLEWSLMNEEKPSDVRGQVLEVLTGDARLVMELLGVNENELWNRFVARARERSDAMRAGITDKETHGETPGGCVSDPVRPRKKFVSGYAQTWPEQKPKRPALPASAFTFAKTVAAEAIMEIDGLDIRLWTLGSIKNAAPKRRHEAAVLERIANDWSHLPENDATEVGTLYSDPVLRRIVEECRA